MKFSKKWQIVVLKTHTDDVVEVIDTYYNKGHAISRLKGLMKKYKGSEIRLAIRKG